MGLQLDGARHRLGPLAPAAALAAVLMLFFTVGRLVMLGVFRERLHVLEGLGAVFLRGLRIDLLTTILATGPLALFCLLLDGERLRRYWMIGALWGALVMGATCFTEIATPTFSPQFESRPNRIFIEYLVYPREVFTAIFEAFLVGTVLSFTSIAAGGWIAWRTARRLFLDVRPWPASRRAHALGLVALVFGCTLLYAWNWPAFLGQWAVHEDHLARSLALNSLVSTGAASLQLLRDELDARPLYGTMPRDELVRRLRRDAACGDDAFPDPALPLLRRIGGGDGSRGPERNVLLIVCEGLGASYVGSLGGRDLTPCFDAFAASGTLFTRCHATGDRTVKGLDALVAGFPPAPGRSPIKMPPRPYPFYTLARALKARGYVTAFHYGGRASFDEMGPFYRRSGFDEIHDQTELGDARFEGPWGVCDEDLFDRTLALLRSRGDRPFFSLVLTTTNHLPFVHPEGKVADVESPHLCVANSIHYADWALGRFLDACSREPWWSETLVLVAGDHNTWTRGPGPLPVDEFRIGAALAGPGVPRRREERLTSQIDLLPTLLHHLAPALPYPGLGRDMEALPQDVPGRCFMQMGFLSAYMREGQLVVYGPAEPPRCYRRGEGGRWTAATLPDELVADGRALFLAAGHLDRTASFRLPAEP